MELCTTRGQSVAEERSICPSCGSEIGEGRRYKDKAQTRIEKITARPSRVKIDVHA
jgi:uncharacterized membrane protein YvbJ